MPRPKIKRGDIVHVIFLDHAQNSKSDDAIKFETFGRITGITRKSYKIHTWKYVDDGHDNPDNEDFNSIVKSTIEYIKVLK